jgi:hypothetical protein
MFCLYWRCIDRHSNIWLSYKVCSRSTEHTGASWKERLDSAWHFLHLTWCPCPFSAHLQVHPSRFANTSFALVCSLYNWQQTYAGHCQPSVFQNTSQLFISLTWSASCVLRLAQWLAQRSGWHLIPLTDWRPSPHCVIAIEPAVLPLQLWQRSSDADSMLRRH